LIKPDGQGDLSTAAFKLVSPNSIRFAYLGVNACISFEHIFFRHAGGDAAGQHEGDIPMAPIADYGGDKAAASQCGLVGIVIHPGGPFLPLNDSVSCPEP
jgi:hypothetical protein